MMKAPYVSARIKRDMAEVIGVQVPATEIPVLVRVHGDQKFEIGETTDLQYEFDEIEEYDRLIRAYGKEPVELTYGGVHGLVDMMSAAPKKAAAAKSKAG